MSGLTPKRLLVFVAVAGLAACGQPQALAPVGGDRLAEVRFAAIDVLTDQHVELMVAPVCTASGTDDDAIACTGTTLDGQTISVSSAADDQDHLLVTVGSATIYDGPLQAVLTAAARPAG